MGNKGKVTKVQCASPSADAVKNTPMHRARSLTLVGLEKRKSKAMSPESCRYLMRRSRNANMHGLI